jgi:hypothetical protein
MNELLVNRSGLDRLARQHRDAGILLDSNLFVLWIIGTTDINLISRHKRTSDYDEKHFQALILLLTRFPTVIVTPHILTEVSNLCSLIDSRLQLLIRETFQTVVQEDFIVELDIHSKEACSTEAFLQLGLTDAVIKNHVDKRVLVVTDDQPLLHALQKAKRPVFSIRRFLSE